MKIAAISIMQNGKMMEVHSKSLLFGKFECGSMLLALLLIQAAHDDF